jgi:hypothetical protein
MVVALAALLPAPTVDLRTASAQEIPTTEPSFHSAATAEGESTAPASAELPSVELPTVELPPPPPAPAPLNWTPRPAGHFAYGALLADPKENSGLAKSAGFTHMWAYVSWKKVEPKKGRLLFDTKDRWGNTTQNDLTNVVQAARRAGLKLVLRIVDPPDWACGAVHCLNPSDVENYVEAVVDYAGRTISHVEVFNEPNLPREWGAAPDPAAYTRLLAAAYRGVKRADSSVQVVAAGVSGRTGGLGGTMEDVDFIEGIYRAGGKPYFDLLGMHPYVGNLAPDSDPSCTPMCFRTLELWRAVMERNGDGGKGAFITEIGTLEHTSRGLGSFDWMKLAPQTRAEYLVKALQLANAHYPWISGAMIFNFDYATTPWNPPSGEHYWFSLLNSDKSPRAALDHFRQARRDGRLP